MVKQGNTEQKILEAAEDVFIQKGMDGTRMQEIADKAGINKALLHYYYRSKDKLFSAVFKRAIQSFVPRMESIIFSDMDFFDKIKVMVESYITMLSKHPFIPMFILREIQRNPDVLFKAFQETGINPANILNAVNQEMEKGVIRKMPPEHFMINVLSLCIFPFAARPMMQRLLFQNDRKAYNNFIEERKTLVAEYIINAIKP
jgi:TetR/AcrR family transcriptional regulator